MSDYKLKLLPKAAIAVAALLTASMPGTILAADDSSAEEIRLLREQIAMLQQRLDAIEERQQATEEKSTRAATTNTAAPAQISPDTVTATLGKKGLALTTADKQYSLNVKARVQADGVLFPDSDDGTDKVYVRRAILTFSGTAGLAKWVVSPNFASGATIEDAWVGMDLGGGATLYAGKLTSVEGLENCRSNAKILFAERGLSNNLTPGREIGVKLDGKLDDGRFYYGVTLTNGAIDGNMNNNNTNLSDDFLLSGRVTYTLPIGLTLGISGSIGEENTTLDGSTDRAMKYKSAGRNTWLTYQTDTAIDGTRYRINPQMYWYSGSFGVLSEYILSSYEMSRGGLARTICNSGYTVEASYVLTGEDASFGGVKPKHPFSFKEGGWGAFELGIRYNAFNADKDLFDGTADQTLVTSSSVQKASAIGASLKWYMTDNLLWAINYETTDFSGEGVDRENEDVITTRMQVSF